jgi:hypothetical protein
LSARNVIDVLPGTNPALNARALERCRMRHGQHRSGVGGPVSRSRSFLLIYRREKRCVLPEFDRRSGAGGVCATTGDIRAWDDTKYPDFGGQWRPVGGLGRFDISKPAGRGQQAPLTREFQAIFEANVKEQAAGGQGTTKTYRCFAPGMPRVTNGYGVLFGVQNWLWRRFGAIQIAPIRRAATGTARSASEHHERRSKMTTFSDSYLSKVLLAMPTPKQDCGSAVGVAAKLFTIRHITNANCATCAVPARNNARNTRAAPGAEPGEACATRRNGGFALLGQPPRRIDPRHFDEVAGRGTGLAVKNAPKARAHGEMTPR